MEPQEFNLILHVHFLVEAEINIFITAVVVYFDPLLYKYTNEYLLHAKELRNFYEIKLFKIARKQFSN